MLQRVVDEIDFGRLGGVVPVVVQDATLREVLMVGFMNQEAFRRTVQTGCMWYFSRKRKMLWKKGEQSGHIQVLKQLYLDCDNDTLLAEVEQIGGACDLGYRSCFDKQWQNEHFVEAHNAARLFDPSIAYTAYTENLRLAIPTGSLESRTRELLTLALGEGEQTCDGELFRAAFPSSAGTAVFFGRNSREIPASVASGEYDAGITGFDLALESGVPVVPIANLGYNKRGQGAALWVVAVPYRSDAGGVHDLDGSTVSSELCRVTHRFFRQHGLSVTVRAPEPGDRSALFNGNPVVELIETGATLRRFGYKPLTRVLTTRAVLIAHPPSYAYTWKRRRIEALSIAFQEAARRLPISDRPLFEFAQESSSLSNELNWDDYRRAWFTQYLKEDI